MIEIAEAYQRLSDTLAGLDPLEGEMTRATHESEGLILSRDVVGLHPNPPFSQSAMDGLAFREGAEHYRVVGTVAAGDAPEQILPGDGEAVRIMTGAPVPSTTDTVEMVEKIEFDGDQARLMEPVIRGQHIRVAGENIKPGDMLYQAGSLITPGVLAGLLSQGVRFVHVKRPLRIGVASTGDEIIDYRRPLGPGQIYNSNGATVAAQLRDPRFEVFQLGVFPDALELTRECLLHNADFDALILSGGVSMGNFDLVPKAAKEAGFKQVFHKIRMKPGKPIWFGVHQNGCLLFGLPGNPVSALVNTMLYVAPVLRARLSGCLRQPSWSALPLAEPLRNKGKLTLFSGVRLEHGLEGLTVRPVKTSGSGDVTRFGRMDTISRIPPQTSLEQGDHVQILLPFPQ